MLFDINKLSTWCQTFSIDKIHLYSGRNFCTKIAHQTFIVYVGRKACVRITGKPAPVYLNLMWEEGSSFVSGTPRLWPVLEHGLSQSSLLSEFLSTNRGEMKSRIFFPTALATNNRIFIINNQTDFIVFHRIQPLSVFVPLNVSIHSLYFFPRWGDEQESIFFYENFCLLSCLNI